jgi:tetratricopeptide (TPR) repeat protein
MHPDVAKSYMNMANVYYRQGKHAEALDYHQKSLSIKITTLGSDHPDVAISKFNMAVLLRNMDKAAESKQMFTEAAGIFRAALGADHPHTKMAERGSAET